MKERGKFTEKGTNILWCIGDGMGAMKTSECHKSVIQKFKFVFLHWWFVVVWVLCGQTVVNIHLFVLFGVFHIDNLKLLFIL